MNRRTFLQTTGAAAAALLLPAHAVPHLPGQIVVVENVGEGRIMVRVDPNTNSLRRLKPHAPQEDGPCLTRDGRRLIYAAFVGSTWQTWQLDLATEQARPLVKASSWPIACTDDNRFVASGDDGIWLYDSAGKPQKKISNAQGMPMQGLVTANGHLLFGDLDEPGHLRVVDIARATDRLLAQGTAPSLAGQGTVVYFHDGRQHYVIPFSGGKRQALHGLPPDAWNLCTSPDGRYLLWSQGTDRAAKLVIAGPDLKPLKTIPIGTSINTVVWGP